MNRANDLGCHQRISREDAWRRRALEECKQSRASNQIALCSVSILVRMDHSERDS
jgi:hypothetical protein